MITADRVTVYEGCGTCGEVGCGAKDRGVVEDEAGDTRAARGVTTGSDRVVTSDVFAVSTTSFSLGEDGRRGTGDG